MTVFKLEQLPYWHADRDLGMYISGMKFILCRESECPEVWSYSLQISVCVCVCVCAVRKQ